MAKTRKTCIVCKTSGKENLTYHRFPSNREFCKIWCHALRLQMNNLPKYAYVCSKHFSTKNFIRGSKRTTIYKYAVPRITEFERPSELKRRSGSSTETASSRTEIIPETDNQRILWASSYNSDDDSTPDEENSSSTLTASEPEVEASKLDFVEPNTDKMHEVSIQEQNLQQDTKIPLQDAIDEEFIKIEYLDLEDFPQSPKIEAEDDLSTGEPVNDQSELGCSTTPYSLSQKISCKRSISNDDECSIQQYSSKKQKLNEAQEQPKKSSCELFLLSLVPHLESMSDNQQLSFQRQVLELLKDIKYPHSKIASS